MNVRNSARNGVENSQPARFCTLSRSRRSDPVSFPGPAPGRTVAGCGPGLPAGMGSWWSCGQSTRPSVAFCIQAAAFFGDSPFCETRAMASSNWAANSVPLGERRHRLGGLELLLEDRRAARVRRLSCRLSKADWLAGRDLAISYQSACCSVPVRYFVNSLAAALCSLSLKVTRLAPPAHEVLDLPVGERGGGYLPLSWGCWSLMFWTIQGPEMNIGASPEPKSLTTS